MIPSPEKHHKRQHQYTSVTLEHNYCIVIDVINIIILLHPAVQQRRLESCSSLAQSCQFVHNALVEPGCITSPFGSQGCRHLITKWFMIHNTSTLQRGSNNSMLHHDIYLSYSRLSPPFFQFQTHPSLDEELCQCDCEYLQWRTPWDTFHPR